MLLFMLILFPALSVLFLLNAQDKAYRGVFASGVISGAVVCVFVSVFKFLHRIPEYSFASNFSYFAVNEYVLPLALLYLLFFFLVKDPLMFRVNSFFLLEGGFFSIYMPYYIIVSCPSAFSFYELFLKPSIWVSMVALVAFFLRSLAITEIKGSKGKFILLCVLVALSLFVPSLLNAIWILNWLKPLFIVLSAIYIAAGVCFLVLDLIFFKDSGEIAS